MSIALSHGLTVELAIACEDIREERGNKISAMGMFTNQISVARFPADIRVAFLFVVRSAEVKQFALKSRILVDGETQGQVDVQLAYTENEPVGNVIIPLGYLRMPGPGSFSIEMAVDESEEWIEVIRKSVSMGAVT